MENKKTAVEYIEACVNNLENLDLTWEQVIRKAKAIEKEQMIELWSGGIDSTEKGGKCFDEYYNKTYNK